MSRRAPTMGELLSNEPAMRLTIYATVFLVMALWELAAPRRRSATSRKTFTGWLLS